MTTEPDPKLVREMAREAAKTSIEDTDFIGIAEQFCDDDRWPADEDAADALHRAIADDLRGAVPTWPDEQPQAERDAAAKFAMDMERLEKNDPAGAQWLKGILAERVEPQAERDSCIHCGRDFSLPYVTRQTGTERCEDCTATCGFPGCGHPDHQRAEQAQAGRCSCGCPKTGDGCDCRFCNEPYPQQAERDADVRAVADVLAAQRAKSASGPIAALLARFADRIAALDARTTDGGAK